MKPLTWYPVLQALADGRCHSGETLGQRLALTRSAIWQRVVQLRALGVPIESSEAGYQVPGGLYLPDAQRLSALVAIPVEVRLDTASTNRDLLDGPGTPCCVLALSQRAGRGRRGRSWVGAPGRTLMLSVGVAVERPLHQLSGLSVALGVAICHYMRNMGVPAQLKWPNDLWVGQRKLAGLLTELKGDVLDQSFVVTGIGLNLASLSGFDENIASVSDTLPSGWSDEETAGLIDVMVKALVDYPGELTAQFYERFNAVDALQGREVEVTSQNARIVGIASGLDANGQLQVINDQGLHAVSAGDVSVRPRS